MSEFLDIVSSGDYRASLEALRDKLAAELEVPQRGADMASLSLRLMQVMEALDGKAVPDEESEYDQLAARRKARLEEGRGAPRRQSVRRRDNHGSE